VSDPFAAMKKHVLFPLTGELAGQAPAGRHRQRSQQEKEHENCWGGRLAARESQWQ